MRKVQVKKAIVSVLYGSNNKCRIMLSKGQRWYVVCEPKTDENDFYIIERDNVQMQIPTKDFNEIFDECKRGSKWE
jgi:hypothetical protein